MLPSRSGILVEVINIASTSPLQIESISLASFFAMLAFVPIEVSYSNTVCTKSELKREYVEFLSHASYYHTLAFCSGSNRNG